MSQKSPVIFAALAVVTTLGAVQLASGHDLADRFRAVSAPANAAGINRAAKADREVIIPQAGAPGRTILFKVESLADTSVLVRIPLEKEARNLPPAPAAAKPTRDKAKKMTLACEPVVSMLTEVAKLLQPGKCVT